MIIEVVYFILGLILGCIIISLFWFMTTKSHQDFLLRENQELKDTLQKVQNENLLLRESLTISNKDTEGLLLKVEEQKHELKRIQEIAKIEFENLANRIFETHSDRFGKEHQVNLLNILNPLNEKIKTFQQRVEEAYRIESLEKASLKEQIRILTELNQQMSLETKNLTQALKGDKRLQGAWGEMILEGILEKSGLQKDQEYFTQVSVNSDEGRYRPDVIVKLPQDKVIIIDSKVSLNAYEGYISSTNEEDTISYAKNHLTAIKKHIETLGGKNYQNLYQESSLDFVLMFVPIEAAFSLVVKEDPSIFDKAINKNIIMVCPSTLIATLKTIASIWRQEKSFKSASEIAKIGGELHDKLVSFVESMQSLESSLRSAHDKYYLAFNKLNGSKGAINSALKLKELGAKTNKNF